MKQIALKVRATDKRNEMHFSVQLNTHAHVFQDKRKRDPKHKKDLKYFY